jgi:hypothetical protein
MLTWVSTVLNLNIIDRVVKEVYRRTSSSAVQSGLREGALCHIAVAGKRHNSRYITFQHTY